jgi:hypothetical protein
MLENVENSDHNIEPQFSVSPTVTILKPPGNVYQLNTGEELALVCHGHGDPMPTITWKREVA